MKKNLELTNCIDITSPVNPDVISGCL